MPGESSRSLRTVSALSGTTLWRVRLVFFLLEEALDLARFTVFDLFLLGVFVDFFLVDCAVFFFVRCIAPSTSAGPTPTRRIRIRIRIVWYEDRVSMGRTMGIVTQILGPSGEATTRVIHMDTTMGRGMFPRPAYRRRFVP